MYLPQEPVALITYGAPAAPSMTYGAPATMYAAPQPQITYGAPPVAMPVATYAAPTMTMTMPAPVIHAFALAWQFGHIIHTVYGQLWFRCDGFCLDRLDRSALGTQF